MHKHVILIIYVTVLNFKMENVKRGIINFILNVPLRNVWRANTKKKLQKIINKNRTLFSAAL